MKKISFGVWVVGLFFIWQGIAGISHISEYHLPIARIMLSLAYDLWLIYIGAIVLIRSRHAPLLAIATESFACFSGALQVTLTALHIIRESYTLSEMFLMLIASIMILIGLIIFFTRPKVREQFNNKFREPTLKQPKDIISMPKETMNAPKGKYALKATIYVVVGLLLNVFGRVMIKEAGKQIFGTLTVIAPYIQIVGFGLWFCGCYFIATGKGYSGWWALLGFVPFIGIISLVLLPNKTKGL